MLARWLLLAALLGAFVACRSNDAPLPAASATLAEAPAPTSLVAELSLGNPKETWSRVRALGGNLAEALPSSLPVLLATSLSLPPAAAGSLDESVPVVGVLLSRKGASEPDVVVGVHVLSGAELVASITLGDGAKFRHTTLAPRLERLLPAPGAPDFDGALGVSGNYLLLATGVDALRDGGRFVAEGVSKRARSEPGLTITASEGVLGGALSGHLRELWQARRSALSARDRAEREAKGRAPDFADPEVLLAGADNTVESWLGVLETSRALSFSLTPEADRLRAELQLTPSKDGAAALLSHDLVVGSAAPLLQLPANTRAALLLRSEADPNAGDPEAIGAALTKLFGERLNAAQAATLVKAFEALAKSRHGTTAFGFVQAPAPALLIRTELVDEAAFTGALGDVLSLLQLPPISAWLSGTVGKPSVELGRTAQDVRHAKIRFQRAPHAPGLPLPASLSVSYQARDGVGYIVVAADDAVGLGPFAAGSGLGSFDWLVRAQQQGLADNTALSVFADARLLAPGGPEAPILLSVGKEADRIAMTLDVSSAALPAVARLFALDRSP